MQLGQGITATTCTLVLQALTLSTFWVVVPRKLRWRREIVYGIALLIYACNLPLSIGCLQFEIINVPGFLRSSALVDYGIITDPEIALGFRILRMIWAVAMTMLICGLVSTETIRNKIIMVIWNIGLLTLAEMILDSVVVMILKETIFVGSSQWNILQAQAAIIFLGLSTIFATVWNSMERDMRQKIIVLIVLLDSSQCVFMVGMWGNGSPQDGSRPVAYFLFCSIFAVLTDFLIFETIAGALHAQNNEIEMERLYQQQEDEYEYYCLMQANIEETAGYRQELKQQLRELEVLVDCEDAVQRETALQEISQRLSRITPIRYCASPVINAVVTVKAEEARRRGIAMQVQTAVDHWKLAEIDQSSLFSNLLDNALENCMDDQPDQFIHLKAGERQGFYFVRVSNSCDPAARFDPTRLPASTKRDAGEHGYGLRILQSIAARYHGQMEINCVKGVFTITILLEINA